MEVVKYPRKLFQVLPVFLLFLLAPETRVLAAEVITCKVPSVRRGEPTNITCYFKEDVAITKRNIKIQHQLPGSGSFDPNNVKTVMDCYWLSAAEYACINAEGYQLDGPLGMTVTVGIANAVEDFEGTYMCEVVPSDPSDIQPCSLKLQAADTISSLTVNIPGQSQANMAVLSRIDAAIGISVVVLIILVAVILIVIFRKQLCKWWLQYCKCWPPQAEAKPDLEKQGVDKKEEIELVVKSVLENMKNSGVISEILKTEVEREVARHVSKNSPPKRPPLITPPAYSATESSFEPLEREMNTEEAAEETTPMLETQSGGDEFSKHLDNEHEALSKPEMKKKGKEEKRESKKRAKEEAEVRKKREKEEAEERKKREKEEAEERKKREKEEAEERKKEKETKKQEKKK